MQIKVKYLENLRIQALFDDFNVISDQPIRYKGDGSAPGPFDYFLASSAMCAAYFIKVYCNARDIPTDDIRLTQDNIVDPDNRYKQAFHIEVELPESLSEKDRKGILEAVERCTVKRVIQNNPDFHIEIKSSLVKDIKLSYELDTEEKTFIAGKDLSLEETITHMTQLLADLGIKIEIASWRNPLPNVWSVHIRDADSPMCFANGKGASQNAALCSALGEYLERISNNYFYNDYYLGEKIGKADFVHYPQEKWFKDLNEGEIPDGLMDESLCQIYNPHGELKFKHLVDNNSGETERGICALPYIKQSDKKEVFIPVNLIGNLFVSNGMSAGNSKYEARVQAISEIFERAIKNKIIQEEITLPDVPKEILKKYPKIEIAIHEFEKKGFPVLVKDASLGGVFPVLCVCAMIPETGGVFASFGAHPKFEVALERSLTELLQGRSFEGLRELPPPTFNEFAVTEPNNIIDHFIDSTGVISWKFFSDKPHFKFYHWNFSGKTQDEFDYLMGIFKEIDKEVYIADFNDLGAYSCRVLVPDYSEIYPKEDLIWDNHNKALEFREDILNIYELSDEKLENLVNKLESFDLDDYMPISELIGIAFDENSVWGQLTVSELKGLIFLALEDYEQAKEMVELFLTFNDTVASRKKYYQLLNILLDIKLRDDLEMDDYLKSLEMMYGKKDLEIALQSISGTLKFYGLVSPTLSLKGIDKHLSLLESYEKLQRARKLFKKV